MKRDVFYFYRSYFEAAMKMQPQEQFALLKGIADYALNGVVPNFTGIADAVFTIIKPILDKEASDFGNGKKGGRPKKENGDKNGGLKGGFNGGFSNSETPSETKEKETITKTDTETDKRTEEKGIVAVAPAPVIKRFVKPTLLELQQYCQEARLHINCDSFLDYYDAKGWRVGSQPMKDWKAAARNWARRQQEQDKPSADFISRTTFNSDYQNARNKI